LSLTRIGFHQWSADGGATRHLTHRIIMRGSLARSSNRIARRPLA
jgi:hypothetical protein